MNEQKKEFPEGHFISMWIGIGMAIFGGIGIPLSIVLKMPGLIGVGPAIGVAFGSGIGASIEARKKKEGLIRPLTNKERNTRKNLILGGILILVVGIGLLIWLIATRP